MSMWAYARAWDRSRRMGCWPPVFCEPVYYLERWLFGRFFRYYFHLYSGDYLLGYTAKVTKDELGTKEVWDMLNRELLGRAKAAVAQRGTGQVLEDPKFEDMCPNLAVFLLSTDDGQGGYRDVSRVSVFATESGWKASVVDVATHQSLFVTIQNPADAFKALDKALGSTKPDWRPWRQDKTTQKGKK